jgi:hypothetical protein
MPCALHIEWYKCAPTLSCLIKYSLYIIIIIIIIIIIM